jgi:hypothetical protein
MSVSYTPVEERLNKKLKETELKRAQTAENLKPLEISELQSKPTINKNTSKILSKNLPGNRDDCSPFGQSSNSKPIEDR